MAEFIGPEQLGEDGGHHFRTRGLRSAGPSIGRRTILGGLAAAAAVPASAASAARFTVEGVRFLLDGRSFQIRAGEMHYPRVPRSCWRDRMRKLKALGLNTLSTYTFWNAHERRPGAYDFSGGLDVATYLRTAQEEGLYVLVRPGPYICGEWDGGGLPTWLYKASGFRSRTTDPGFLAPAARWLNRLGQELAPLEIDRGGPILMTAVENEYGSYGQDSAYMAASRRMVRDAGFAGMLYTADGAAVMEKGMLPDATTGIDFAATDDAAAEFSAFDRKRPGVPRFCAELWTGWFDHIGEDHHTVPTRALVTNLDWMMARGVSFNLYMAHGGTSFGFDAGANDQGDGYTADISSYDYDAPLDEAGRPTAKFAAVREVLQKASPTPLPPLPSPERRIRIARFALAEQAPLAQAFDTPRGSVHPLSFAACDLPHGLMLYRHRLKKTVAGVFAASGLHDLALVSVDGRLQGAVDRRLSAEPRLPIAGEAGDMLEVLVMAFGRVNFGPQLDHDPKGLIGPATLAGDPLLDWEHLAAPLEDLSQLRFSRPPPGPSTGSAFHRGVFQLDAPGYTFLDLRGWGRGYAWVNGRNLGRHDSLGPQRRLFVPSEATRAGTNTVVVLDLERDGERTASGAVDPLWDIAKTAGGPR